MLVRRCVVQCLCKKLSRIESKPLAILKQRLNDTRYQSFEANEVNKQANLEKIEREEPILHRLSHFADDLGRHFLPKEYPASVGEGYIGFARGQFSASMFGSAGGVLAMQSLLYAVGLGAGAIPLAATVNWVLRDGLGQLGGVIFSSVAGSRFDADPKRWRMAAALALEASALVELLTPLAPAYFLLIASVANIGKNISFLAASASRAAIHKSFAVSENLADVTAKTGSQSIFSSTLGTGLGITLASLIGNEYGLTVGAFLVLSSLSLCSTYFSINHVTINTISVTRLELLLAHYLAIDKSLEKATPTSVLLSQMATGGASSLYERQLLSPAEVRSIERLLAVPRPLVLPPLSIGSDLNIAFRNSEQLEAVLGVFPAEDCKHLISIQPGANSSKSINNNKSEVHLLFREGATLHDVVMGMSEAYIARLLLLSERGPGGTVDLLKRARQIAGTEVFPGISLCRCFADKLVLSDQSQWLASTGLLETRFARVSHM